MNFALRFIIGRQLALSQGVSTQQATSDGLISALLRTPLGLVLAAVLARSQASAAAPSAVQGGGATGSTGPTGATGPGYTGGTGPTGPTGMYVAVKPKP